MNRRRLSIAALSLLALAAGCAKQSSRTAGPGPWYGPTERLDVVLARINANNDRISTLNGDGRFDAWINDGRDERYVNGSMTLLHTKPDRIRMLAKKDLAGDLFELGSNGEIFWLDARVADTVWHGKVGDATRAASTLPISPALIADVLGVGTLNSDLLAQPVPMMRFNPDYRAYMLTWSRPIGDRWVVLREVWYDRETLEPRRVWLFDHDGRVVLRGVLSNFGPLDSDENDPNAPRVARRYDLFFPESKSRLDLRLDDLRASVNGTPNRITYRFAPERSPSRKKIDLDAVPTTGRVTP